MTASRLGRAYKRLYEILAGPAENPRPWHFQWLATFGIHRKLRRFCGEMEGRVLDFGCGAKPYRRYFRDDVDYVGVDIVDGPHVDHVVAPGNDLPFPDQSFDAVLSTEVLEHLEDLNHVLGEMRRVVKASGMVVLTVPFLYNELGAPYDFRRLTRFFFSEERLEGFRVEKVEVIGGYGSTSSIMFLNWVESMFNTNRALRILKALLLPAWLPVSFIVNILAA